MNTICHGTGSIRESRGRFGRRGGKALWIVALAGLLGGCVDRELTIATDPPDAQVFVSDTEVGRSPVTFPFTWYGDYDIIIRKNGYETLKTHANVNTPWYMVPPVDFFSEIAPWWYRDRRHVSFKLSPATQPSDSDLIQRAKDMHERNLRKPL